MINVLFYALPNTNSGGYSVVLNLYEDIKKHKTSYPDIHWYIITGVDGFENTDNITVLDERWALKSYFHRLYFNCIVIKKIIKKYEIKVVLSLNMGIRGLRTPSIISLHNVLPFYNCGKDVFDSYKDIIKQKIINRMIVKSLKQARYVIVPSNWIKNKLESEFDIDCERIAVSPIATPEMNAFLIDAQAKKNYNVEFVKEFIYPASGFPYKNHRVIVEAAKHLLAEGVSNFYIRFAGNVGNGKTIRDLRTIIKENKLPIDFCGLLSKEELMRSYQCGTLIFPSKIETDAFPILESMACGGYIIAAEIDYAKEALVTYDNYNLFNPDDEIQLAELMKRNIANCDNRKGNEFSQTKSMPRTKIISTMIRKIANKDYVSIH